MWAGRGLSPWAGPCASGRTDRPVPLSADERERRHFPRPLAAQGAHRRGAGNGEHQARVDVRHGPRGPARGAQGRGASAAIFCIPSASLPFCPRSRPSTNSQGTGGGALPPCPQPRTHSSSALTPAGCRVTTGAFQTPSALGAGTPHDLPRPPCHPTGHGKPGTVPPHPSTGHWLSPLASPTPSRPPRPFSLRRGRRPRQSVTGPPPPPGLKASLERLQLEYVDVVFANRPDPNTPMEGGFSTGRPRGPPGA